jgi:hypothetical protein
MVGGGSTVRPSDSPRWASAGSRGSARSRIPPSTARALDAHLTRTVTPHATMRWRCRRPGAERGPRSGGCHPAHQVRKTHPQRIRQPVSPPRESVEVATLRHSLWQSGSSENTGRSACRAVRRACPGQTGRRRTRSVDSTRPHPPRHAHKRLPRSDPHDRQGGHPRHPPGRPTRHAPIVCLPAPGTSHPPVGRTLRPRSHPPSAAFADVSNS